MNKKLLSSLAIVFTVITALTSVVLSYALPVGAKELFKEREVIVADFESFDHQYNIADMYANFAVEGYITQSKESDPNNIQGRSLEVYSEGTVAEFWAAYDRTSGYPAAFSYDIMTNTIHGSNYGFDWKYLSGLSVDVNNVNDFALQVSMFMNSENDYPYHYGTMRVEANSKATLTSNVNRYFMQNEYEDTFRYIVILIDYDRQVYDEADLAGLRRDGFIKEGDLCMPPMRVYFDNLKFKVNENDLFDKNGAVIVDKKFESATEILNFNQSADLTYIRETANSYVKESDNDWITKAYEKGTGSAVYYNTNEKYIHEGNVGSLEWRVNPTHQNTFHSAAHAYRYTTCTSPLSGFTVVGEYLNYLNFSKIKDGKVKICVDIYNAAGYDKEVAFGIHDYSGIATEVKSGFPYFAGTIAMKDVWTRCPAGQWTTLEITDFSHLDLSQGIARLRLNTSILDVTEPISFYVNNLRFVYEA